MNQIKCVGCKKIIYNPRFRQQKSEFPTCGKRECLIKRRRLYDHKYKEKRRNYMRKIKKIKEKNWRKT